MTPIRLLKPAVAVTVALAFLSGAAAARADQTIATTPRPTKVATGQGLIAYSSYDPKIHAYRLMIDRLGNTQPANVAPSPTPFDVDVGPTASGHAYVVYSRCEDRSTPVPKGCEIYAYDMRTGRENRYDASSPTESEVHPTYWAGRLVFVRYYGRLVFVRYHGPDDDPRPVVYMLRARSSRTSQRLPGLPARRCLERNGCGSVTGTVDTLGQTASTVTHTRLDRRLTEVRLVDVKSGRSEQIASRGRGESGQEFIGPLFRIGRLYTYFTCHGETGGCIHGIGGAYR